MKYFCVAQPVLYCCLSVHAHVGWAAGQFKPASSRESACQFQFSLGQDSLGPNCVQKFYKLPSILELTMHPLAQMATHQATQLTAIHPSVHARSARCTHTHPIRTTLPSRRCSLRIQLKQQLPRRTFTHRQLCCRASVCPPALFSTLKVIRCLQHFGPCRKLRALQLRSQRSSCWIPKKRRQGKCAEL